MGRDRATRVGSLAHSVTSLSAGGQDEQPWLVNSSTTARGCAQAPPIVAAAKRSENAMRRMRMVQSRLKCSNSAKTLEFGGISEPALWAWFETSPSGRLEDPAKSQNPLDTQADIAIRSAPSCRGLRRQE